MTLQKGDTAPNFNYTEDGVTKQLYSITGNKVVFFFPRAFTPSCTKEACSLQDSYEDLKQEGVSEVIGISMDSEDKQQKFKEKYGLDYILVSDRDKSISEAYGVAKRKFFFFKLSDRYTFVIDEDNIITDIYENGLKGTKSKYGIDKHGTEILEDLTLSDQ